MLIRLLLTLLVFAMPAWAEENLLLSNAQIVDPLTKQIKTGHLLIKDGHISATLQSLPEDFEGKTIDLQGKWIIPGLNELHTHSGGNRGLNGAFESVGTPVIANRLLSVGVTSLLDLFSDENTIYQHRKDQQAGLISGADIFTSLSCLTASRGHCTEYGIQTRTMNTPLEAVTVVQDLASKHPDVIKINYNQFGKLPNISKETLTAAIAAANKAGIKTVVHINSVADIYDAVEAGASAVTHLPREKVIPTALAKIMAKTQVASIPTLATRTDLIDFINDPSVLSAPMATMLTTKEILDSYADKGRLMSTEKIASLVTKNEIYYQSTQVLAQAGVMMLTGSDGGNSGTIQGYSVHREMIKLVRSGLTSWQALAASTTNAGIFLGKKYGVNVGDEANLVILRASPIEDIKNTQKIEYVIHHGKVVLEPSMKPQVD